jgi:hypothetical protein
VLNTVTLIDVPAGIVTSRKLGAGGSGGGAGAGLDSGTAGVVDGGAAVAGDPPAPDADSAGVVVAAGFA